jgi:hypothetical protein
VVETLVNIPTNSSSVTRTTLHLHGIMKGHSVLEQKDGIFQICPTLVHERIP